jgi:hypothetical protein
MKKNKRKPLKKIDFGFQPLEDVTKPTVATDHAAYLLNRVPRTLRGWASLENGPIRPIRVFGKLAWSVADIKALLGLEAQ